MNGSASSLIAQPPLPWRRVLWALAASLLLHLVIVDLGFGGRGAQLSLPVLLLHAELAAVPLPSEADAVAGSAAVAVPAIVVPRALTLPAQPGSQDAVPSDPAQAAGIADQRVYQARELDRYPQPLLPLSLRRPPGSGLLRVWLTIDASGHVVDMAGGSAGQPIDAALREQLLTVIYSPALRDQRTVKSRILLELDD